MKLRLFLIALLAGAPLTESRANTFEVAPTIITLPPEGGATVFYITNHGDAPVVTQIEGFAWHQHNNKDLLDSTDALILSPPMARLLPNQKQTVRLLVKPDPAATAERAYRLVVSEIPDPAATTPQARIRMLLQFSVPVFVAAPGQIPPAIDWTGALGKDGATFTAHNSGGSHAKIAGLTFETQTGQLPVTTEAFRYVLPGAAADWTMPAAASPLSSGQSVRVTAHDESSNTPFNATLSLQ